LALNSLPDDTVVCRCEEVSAGAVRRAVNDGAIGPAQAKAFTRCGMGPCQGRICGLQISRLIAEETGIKIGEVGSYNVRFPLTPVPLKEMAEGAEKLGIGENHAG
jgi:NAD(P)H-nitrite reductase large subunit